MHISTSLSYLEGYYYYAPKLPKVEQVVYKQVKI